MIFLTAFQNNVGDTKKQTISMTMFTTFKVFNARCMWVQEVDIKRNMLTT